MGIAYQKEINWHDDVLPKNTRKALSYLAQQKWLKQSRWYLAGGTALALHEGHRQSLDLDFFIDQKDFSIGKVITHFPKDILTINIAREGTIYGSLFNAKVSFIAYPFFKRKEPVSWFGNVRIIGSRDIAVMKIIAISQRGRKRDFVDLYWHLIHHQRLAEILLLLPKQYPSVAHDYHHIIKSLTYFDDAEHDPMPKLFFHTSWIQIKKYFQKEAVKITKDFFGIH